MILIKSSFIKEKKEMNHEISRVSLWRLVRNTDKPAGDNER